MQKNYKFCINIILIFLIFFATATTISCGGGGGDSVTQITPPPPPPAPIAPPSNVLVSGGQIPGFIEGSLGIKVTWDSSPDIVDAYEIQHTWPGQDQLIIIVVYLIEGRECWISLGPELVQTSLQVRARKNGIYSTWTSPVYYKAGPNPPKLEISSPASSNSVPIKISRTSMVAEKITIERAEGDLFSHSNWEVIKTIDYTGNSVLNIFDAEVQELHNYVYRAQNQAQGMVGGYSSIGYAMTAVFIPGQFQAEQVTGGVKISWINRSKICTSLELYRADDFSPTGSPVGEVLISTFTSNTTEGFDSTLIQSGFYIYYLRLISPQINSYGSGAFIRFLGKDAFLEKVSTTMPQAFNGVPGGRPNGPTYTMAAFNNSLTITKIGNDQTPVHVIQPVSSVLHPGIWVDTFNNPHLIYLKPNGTINPDTALSQTYVHTWMENAAWKEEPIGELPINVPWNWDFYSHMALGPDNPLAFTIDHISVIGPPQPQNEDSRVFHWKENGTWKRSEFKFVFQIREAGLPEDHTYLNFTVVKDGTWFVAYAGRENSLILFQSVDHGISWSRQDYTLPYDYVYRPITHLHIISQNHLFIFRARQGYPPHPHLEWLSQEIINGIGGPEEHVLFSNNTGIGVSIRSRYNSITNSLAILADLSMSLTVGIRPSTGEWKICPVLPGEWRQSDRLDTCLFDWDETSNSLFLLEDYDYVPEGAKMKLIKW